MKRFISVIIILLLLAKTGLSQEELLNNDSLLKVYLSQSYFPIAPDAPAVILEEKGTADFRKYAHEVYNSMDYTIEYKVERYIKLIKNSSLKEADIVLPYSRKATLKKVTGTTIFLKDGKIVRETLDHKSILKEKITENVHQYKFNLSKVQTGAIIHYTFTYSLDEGGLSHRNSSNLEWSFRSTHPALCSEFEIIAESAAMYRNIVIHPRNVSFTTVHSENDFAHTDNAHFSTVYEVTKLGGPVSYIRKLWKQNNTMPLREEPLVTNLDNWDQKLLLAISGAPDLSTKLHSWENANNSFYHSITFGKLLFAAANDARDSVLEKLQQRYPDQLDLAKTIFRYFRDSVNYNGYLPTLTEYLQRSEKGGKKKPCSTRFNLRLIQILRKAGFKALPVVLATNDKERQSADYCTIEDLDVTVAIVIIDGRYYLLDAASGYQPFGVLRPQCYNGRALIVSEKGIPIDLSPDSLEEKSISMATMTPGAREGLYDLLIEHKLGNVSGPATRRLLHDDSAMLVEKLKEELNTSRYKTRVKDITFLNSDNPDTSLIIRYMMEIELDTINDRTYINPYLQTHISKNPFTAVIRNYPIEFGYTLHHQFILKLQLPLNYTLEDYAPQVTLKLADNSTLYHSTMLYDETQRIFSLNCLLQCKKATIGLEHYDELRSFYDKIITEQNKKITLIKK